MRVNGVEAKRRGVLPPIVFPRDDGEFLAFYVQPVYDLDEFDILCPEPDPKKYGMLTKDGWVTDYEAPALLDELKRHRMKRWEYIVIKSLEPSNITWDKVDPKNPKTWHHHEAELRGVMSYSEFGQLMGLIDEANSLNKKRLEENRETFFRKLAERQQKAEAGQCSGQENTSSGEPASDSV